MSPAPFRDGDFVWANFPQRESPIVPGPQHIAYVVAVSGSATGHSAMVAYTSSQLWEGALPLGVRRFPAKQARALGQDRAFVLDMRRIAWLPINDDWFPQLSAKDRGVVGHASDGLRKSIASELTEIFQRRASIVERLGPMWPRPT